MEGGDPFQGRVQASCPVHGVRLPKGDLLIWGIREMRTGGGWEETGTLAPRAATVLWELSHKFPEFSHINFRTSPRNPRSSRDGPAPVRAALRKGTARGRGCLA